MSQDRREDGRVHVRLPSKLDEYLEDLDDQGVISSKAEHMRNLVREDMRKNQKVTA